MTSCGAPSDAKAARPSDERAGTNKYPPAKPGVQPVKEATLHRSEVASSSR